MHASFFTTLVTLALSTTLATASPLTTRSRQPPFITLRLQTSYGLDQNHVYTNVTIPINTLSSLEPCDTGNGCALSEMVILSTLNTGDLPISQFECRGYKDAAGLSPGSAPFTVKNPAEVSTNLGTERAVLCYVRAAGEVEDEA